MTRFLVIACAVLIASCARPTAKYIITTTDPVAPAEVSFKNESENAEAYSWDFGDGTTSTDENPDHRYLLSGRYDVALTAIKEKRKNVSTQTIVVTAPDKCLVQLETEYGTMLIELYDNTPNHRDNFTKLISEGFYDSLLFHRVMDGFMIQGGDPNSRNAGENVRLGSSGPGYQLDKEFTDENVHVKGALAAARQPDNVNPEKKSSGSQFYIVQGGPVSDGALDDIERRTGIVYTDEQRALYKERGGTAFLDRLYTVFGMVVEGMEVIDRIAEIEVKRGNRPVKNTWMKLTVIK